MRHAAISDTDANCNFYLKSLKIFGILIKSLRVHASEQQVNGLKIFDKWFEMSLKTSATSLKKDLRHLNIFRILNIVENKIFLKVFTTIATNRSILHHA